MSHLETFPEEPRCPHCGEKEGAADEIERLRAALEVCNQMVLEVSHAQQCGPGWYTRGEDGLRAQVDMWVRKASTAIREALDNAG